MAKGPKLKIGLVLDTSLDSNEGVPQYVVHIGEWLRSQGHDVHYLVGETKRRDLANIHSLSRNVAISFNGSRTTIPLPTSRPKLRHFIQQNHFDVLHVQTPHHPLLAQRLILAADKQTAVIGTFHILPYGQLPRLGNRALGIWLRPSLNRIDTMLAVSPAAAEFCLESFGIRAEISPNVVDYNLFHKAKPLEGLSDDKLTVLYLGKLVERKGAKVLLEAVANLTKSKSAPPFRVVVCGRGPQEKHLRQYAENQNLTDIVSFAGFVSETDKPRYYASADIAVFPSSSGESFGIVMLEAMAAGKAVVLAGDNPGYRSVMEPQPELLFPAKDPKVLATKISRYMNDQTQRKRLAEWGNDYVKQFDVNVVGEKLLGVYHEALHKRQNL